MASYRKGAQSIALFVQVKTLRLLQYFPPPSDPATLRTLNELLRKIITGSNS